MISYKSTSNFKNNHLKKAYQNKSNVYIFPKWFLFFSPIPLKYFAYRIIIFETVDGYMQFKKNDSNKVLLLKEPFPNVYLPSKKVKKDIKIEESVISEIVFENETIKPKKHSKTNSGKISIFSKIIK